MSGWGLAWSLLGIGWYIALCLVGGVLVGVWLDSKCGSGVIFTFVFLTIGLIVALIGTYGIARSIIKEDDNDNQDSKDNPSS